MTTIIISNKEIDNIVIIVESLEDGFLLVKGISKTIKNVTKEQKGGFLSMLFGTIGTNLLENLLKGKGVKQSKLSNIP